MNVIDVESVVRDVIVHYGMPFTVLAVSGSPSGWNVMVRTGTEGIVRFCVPDGRPVAIRAAIQETLEAHF